MTPSTTLSTPNTGFFITQKHFMPEGRNAGMSQSVSLNDGTGQIYRAHV